MQVLSRGFLLYLHFFVSRTHTFVFAWFQVTLGNRKGPSTIDVKQMNLLYKCSGGGKKKFIIFLEAYFNTQYLLTSSGRLKDGGKKTVPVGLDLSYNFQDLERSPPSIPQQCVCSGAPRVTKFGVLSFQQKFRFEISEIPRGNGTVTFRLHRPDPGIARRPKLTLRAKGTIGDSPVSCYRQPLKT